MLKRARDGTIRTVLMVPRMDTHGQVCPVAPTRPSRLRVQVALSPAGSPVGRVIDPGLGAPSNGDVREARRRRVTTMAKKKAKKAAKKASAKKKAKKK